MAYHISENIDKNKIFIVNRSEIEGRLEPYYYRPSISLLEKKVRSLTTKRLKNYAISIAGGATPNKTEAEKYYSDDKSGIPFLRVQNLQTTGELSLDGCLYINKETHNGLLRRSQVSEGDLLIKITGVGRMAIASVAPKDFIGNTNQHMVVVKTGNTDISKYLAQYLNLDIIEKIASRHSTGGTRPALDYSSLKNLPIIENLNFSAIEDAIEIKKEKDRKAKDLLKTIDEYLFEKLGVTIPKIDKNLRNRIFFSSLKKIESNRIDPTYSLCLDKIVSSTKYKNIYLRSIAHIVKGNALSSSEVENGDIPVIAGGQTSPYKHNRSNYEGNVITVSASGAYAGYVWYHDYPIYATDCSVIFSKDESIFLTKYLFEVLKFQQDAIYRLQTGAAQPHVYPADLQMLNIPFIPIDKQDEIVKHIKNIRDEAKSLQKEGNDNLNKAKKIVENMIMDMYK